MLNKYIIICLFINTKKITYKLHNFILFSEEFCLKHIKNLQIIYNSSYTQQHPQNPNKHINQIN